MDIFKLFFDHDLRLDKPDDRNANKTEEELEARLADFMKPTPTYSKFYLTGTWIDEEKFGINTLEQWEELQSRLEEAFKEKYFTHGTDHYANLIKVLENAATGDAILISDEKEPDIDTLVLNVARESNVGHFKEELADVLQEGYLIIYKEQSHDGFDLHLFSLENIYDQLFHAFKPLVGPTFRFFSINSKRMRSERHFYFETWSLDKPPHGAEEILPETVL